MRYTALFFVALFLGCKTVNISDANKTFSKKGLKSAKDYIDYSVSFESKKEFNVDNISIENSSSKIEYYYKDLSSGLTSYKMMNPFSKGKYQFKFRLKEIDNISKDETLIFEYSIEGEKKKKKIPIVLNPNTVVKR